MAITALHAGSAFMVPRRGESPDVGFWPSMVEPLENELAELAASYLPLWPGDPLRRIAFLTSFALQVLARLKTRAAQNVDDGIHTATPNVEPLSGEPPKGDEPDRCSVVSVDNSAENEEKRFAARVGRFIDWMCRGRRVLDMGPRAFVFASFVRADAVDGRTDQEAAREIGNDSRASINRIKKEFRRDLGADYPGATGKSRNTRRKCKNSRLKQLKQPKKPNARNSG